MEECVILGYIIIYLRAYQHIHRISASSEELVGPDALAAARSVATSLLNLTTCSEVCRYAIERRDQTKRFKSGYRCVRVCVCTCARACACTYACMCTCARRDSITSCAKSCLWSWLDASASSGPPPCETKEAEHVCRFSTREREYSTAREHLSLLESPLLSLAASSTRGRRTVFHDSKQTTALPAPGRTSYTHEFATSCIHSSGVASWRPFPHATTRAIGMMSAPPKRMKRQRYVTSHQPDPESERGKKETIILLPSV